MSEALHLFIVTARHAERGTVTFIIVNEPSGSSDRAIASVVEDMKIADKGGAEGYTFMATEYFPTVEPVVICTKHKRPAVQGKAKA